MLPKKKRLVTARFMDVLKRGKSVTTPFLTLKYKDNLENRAKFSVVVPKAVESGAVGRNALRRRIYAVLQGFSVQKPVSGILFLKKEAKNLAFSDLEKEIQGLLRRAGLL